MPARVSICCALALALAPAASPAAEGAADPRFADLLKTPPPDGWTAYAPDAALAAVTGLQLAPAFCAYLEQARGQMQGAASWDPAYYGRRLLDAAARHNLGAPAVSDGWIVNSVALKTKGRYFVIVADPEAIPARCAIKDLGERS